MRNLPAKDFVCTMEYFYRQLAVFANSVQCRWAAKPFSEEKGLIR